ncbi:response regulator transcription factor [Paenibacillus harenae]|uniref:response regulator transcription factor n=1 Tax=Paenibacillus harenae TaxID=306543 RepID=UPI00042965D9|nr:response regulator [Paenibacillus harenae]
MNILVVDDEYYARKALIQAIQDWNEETLIIEAENGQEALEKVESSSIDLILTDIRMPKMDGIQLAAALLQYHPSVINVIISGYDDFKFAQQAIVYKVENYLVKPVEKKELFSLLENIQEKIKKVKTQKRTSPTSADLIRISKNKWIRYTIHDPIWDVGRWLIEAKECGLELEMLFHLPVICSMNKIEKTKKRFQLSEDALSFAFENAMEELFSDGKMGIFFKYSLDKGLLIFSFRDGIKVNRIDEMKCLLVSAQQNLKKFMKLDVSFIFGNICKTPVQLKEELRHLFHSDEQFFYMEHEGIAKKEEILSTEKDLNANYAEALDNFFKAMVAYDSSRVSQCMDKWMSFIAAERYKSTLVKQWIVKMMIELEVKTKPFIKSEKLGTAEMFRSSIIKLQTMMELKESFIDYLAQMSSLMGEEKMNSKRRITDVQRYVIANIDKFVSLDEIAAKLHLNASYLSRLFKKETGENFIEYMTRVKLDRAKELLQDSQKSLEEISGMIGYEKNYFYKVFKKSNGMTPSEFRTSISNIKEE